MDRPQSAAPARDRPSWTDSDSEYGSGEERDQVDDREAPEVLGSNLVSACKKGNENDARALLLEGAGE